MKQSLLLLSFWLAGCCALLAQMPNGSTAPNFTVVDINGNSHNLYNLLDQGKTVYLDFFAVWCGPCWNYHNSNALKDLWNQYGPPGTDEAFVIMIEGDCNTNTACITASPGCNSSNQGNWAAGTPYPIVDNCSVRSLYQVAYYPTIYMVCPADKKVYEVGQQGASGLWNARSTYCPPLVVNATVNSVTNTICYGSNTGSIDISVSGGLPPYTYQWSNGATTQDLTNIPAGVYECTITNAQGWPGETGPIVVEDPAAPLDITVIETSPAGCNGVFGSIEVASSGGWDGHVYFWNNGLTGTRIEALGPGSYTCTVVDERGCTRTVNQVLTPPTNPVASIAPPGTVTCATPNITLSGSGTGGYSGNYTFQWSASGGGNIVSGANTPNPVVNAAGIYILQIADEVTNCWGFANTTVTANTDQPAAAAGPSMEVSCAVPTTLLQGSGSVGNNMTYQWTAFNGGHIVSGANTLSPTVDASGNYVLVVTNTTNGCTQNDTTVVVGNNIPPTAEVEHGDLTCVVASVILSTVTNATDPIFAWTGPDGFESDEQSPEVGEAGDYVLIVSDPNTGCTNSTTVAVVSNTMPPGAEATGGTLTCSVTSIELAAEAEAPEVTYAWSGPEGFESELPNPSTSVPGTYSLIITDSNNGCTSTAEAEVAENTTPPAASANTPGTLNCNVGQIELDGSASAQGDDITYLWTTDDGNILEGENTTAPIVDAPGAYLLVVTNAENGCTATATTAVVLNAPVSADVEDIANVLCHGGSTGSATAIAGGGNSEYTFEWSNGETTATVTNLVAGTYTVLITDGDDCTATASVVIAQPPALAPNASATAQTAANTNDGTATANPTGGTGDYTYLWNNGETTQTITDLAPGNYTVEVTDENGCTAVQTVIVNAFDCTIAGTASSTDITCFGAQNGTANVTLLGANDPVTYTWSNGANTAELSNLAAGTYTVEIIDNTNCADVLQVVITEPTELHANAAATGETALGANDGTATANPAGGTGAYTYEWSNSETTQTISDLEPGTYTVTVQDENGCTDVQVVVVNAFNCAVTAQPAATDVACFGQNNGTLSVNLLGATEPYTYLWSNGETTASIENLAPGTYTASVTDANGCGVVVEGTVAEPSVLELSGDVTHPACAGEASGAVATSAIGGTGDYTYTWSNGASTSGISDLGPGEYAVVLSDENGCTTSATYVLDVADNIAPAIAAENTTLELGVSGAATATLQTLGASVTDNCTVASVTIEPSVFDCSDLGEQNVTITATDNAGNTSSMTITVTVVDNTPPSVTCPANLVACWYENAVSYNAPVAQDNCLSVGGNFDLLEGLPSGSEFPLGETVQTYAYTDASGNTGTCSFTVTVTVPIKLDVPVITNDVNSQGVGAIDIAPTGGTEPYQFVWTDANGNVVGTTEDLTGLTAGTYSVQIKDANGCVFTTEGFVVDNTSSTVEPAWLRGATLRPNPTSGIAQIIFADIPTSELQVTVSDATGRIVHTQYVRHQATVRLDCTHLPEGMYVVRFLSGSESGVRKLMVGR